MKYFVHLRYDVIYAEFKLLQIDQKATKICTRLFIRKIDKICHESKGEVLASGPL